LCALLAAASPCAAAPATRPAAAPLNLAPSAARVRASSEFSADYLARFAIDGRVPATLGRSDLRQAWCVRRASAGDKGELTLEWESPVTIGAVVYYGRTSWELAECWREYQIVLDDAAAPVAAGKFEMTPAGQVVNFRPTPARKLSLRFLSSHGGSNPGAAEIQVFASAPPREALIPVKPAPAVAPPAAPFAESPDVAATIAAGNLGFDRLVVAKRHALDPSHVYTAHCEGFKPGGGIYTLSPPRPDGRLTELLASPEGEILSLDVSYDGAEILFAWKRTAKAAYHLFRMNADGSGLAQLTDGEADDYYACYLPDGGIAFVSTRDPRGPLCFHTATGVLFRMDRDGRNVRKLSASYVDDFTPAILPDGRLLYTRWEYVDRPAIPIQSLWTMHPDGTNLRAFFGNRVLSPASFLQARAVPGTHLVMCTLTSHNGPVRGAVGLIDVGRGNNAQAGIVNLTPEVRIGETDRGDGNNVRGPYEWPVPLDARRYLVSRDGALMLGEIGKGLATLRAADGAMGWYGAMPLAPRRAPPVLRPPTADDAATATVYVADVYRGLDGIARGTVKELRVVEEVAKPFAGGSSAFGFQTPVVSCGATYAVKRVWGTAAVADDGSACFTVPADRPIYFIALDADGVAVQRMRSFTHLRPGETQGCIGCHEPRNTAPPARENAMPAAVRHGAQDLVPPSWGVAGFDYARQVQPVLDKHCVSCHAGPTPDGKVDLSGDTTEWFNASYDTLTRGWVNWIPTHNGAETNILEIAPKAWGSPRSKLTKVILGTHPDADGKPRIQLDRDARDRILTWIDLNVPYYGTYAQSPGLPGGRRLYPVELKAKLADVWARRCVSCHAGKQPPTDYVRIDNPQLNAFLAAPLATTAGGRGACKPAAPFASADDADYRTLLDLIVKVKERAKSQPRADMPGAPATDTCVAKPEARP